MVANITTGKSILGALIYNQQKVDKGKASVLATSLIRERSDGKYDAAQMLFCAGNRGVDWQFFHGV